MSDSREDVLGVFIDEALGGRGPATDGGQQIRRRLERARRDRRADGRRRVPDRRSGRPASRSSRSSRSSRLPLFVSGALAAGVLVVVIITMISGPATPTHDAVLPGPDAVWQLADGTIQLQDGWLLVSAGAPAVHRNDTVAHVESGRALLVAGSTLPDESVRADILKTLNDPSITPALTGNQKEQIMIPTRWQIRGSFALLVLTGTLLVNNERLVAQDANPADDPTTNWFAPELPADKVQADRAAYRIPDGAGVIGLRSDGFVWFGKEAGRVRSLPVGTPIDAAALGKEMKPFADASRDANGISESAVVVVLGDAAVPMSRLKDLLMVCVSPEVQVVRISIAARIRGRAEWIGVPFNLPVDMGPGRGPGRASESARLLIVQQPTAEEGKPRQIQVLSYHGPLTERSITLAPDAAAVARAALASLTILKADAGKSATPWPDEVVIHLWPPEAPAGLAVGLRVAANECAPDARIKLIPSADPPQGMRVLREDTQFLQVGPPKQLQLGKPLRGYFGPDYHPLNWYVIDLEPGQYRVRTSNLAYCSTYLSAFASDQITRLGKTSLSGSGDNRGSDVTITVREAGRFYIKVAEPAWGNSERAGEYDLTITPVDNDGD